MRSVEPLNSGRFKVRYRHAGKQSSQTFGTRKEAERFAVLLDALDPQGALDQLYDEAQLRDVPTLDQVAAQHVEHLEGAGRAHKVKSQRLWERTWGPRLGRLPANRVTRDDLIRALDDLARSGRGVGRGYSEKSLKNQRGLLHGVLDRAVAQGYLTRHPGLKLKIPQVTIALDEDSDDPAEMVCMTPAEFEILYAATSERYRPLVRFMVGTGARWGEAVVLRPSDIDLTARTVRIRRALKWSPDGKFTIGPPKTRKSKRTITLPSEVAADLAELMDRSDGYVFTSAKGGMIQHRTFWSDHWRPGIWRAQRCPAHRDPECRCGTAHLKRCPTHRGKVEGPCRCPAALGPTPRLHDLRHTHASWLLGAGVPITVVQARLGHESIQTTVDTYGHLLPDAQLAAAAAADAVFGGLSPLALG